MWEQVRIGVPLVLAFLAASLVAVLSRREDVRNAVTLWITRLTLVFAVVATALAFVHWLRYPDWMHLLWTSTHPQLAVFAASGAFLVRDARRRHRGERGHGVWLVLGLLVFFALAPLVLMEIEPKPNAGPRDVGRGLEGTLEVASFGLGGPLPAVLVPYTELGEQRGMGFLPREVTVPVGALATAALLWIAVCVIRFVSLCVEDRYRAPFLLLAPFGVAALRLVAPLPFGVEESGLWGTSPFLMRMFGPVLALAASAAVWVALEQRRARRERKSASVRS